MPPRAAFGQLHVRPAAPAQLCEPVVGQAVRGQRRSERLAAEVRVAARAGKAPHICYGLDVVATQDVEKVRERVRGVADCPDLALGRAFAGWWEAHRGQVTPAGRRGVWAECPLVNRKVRWPRLLRTKCASMQSRLPVAALGAA